MSSSVPDPPPTTSLLPLSFIWRKGNVLVRCHNRDLGATEFNPGYGSGRFHPLADEAGNPVPTLYAADTLEGALSETVFHSVPVRGTGKRIGRHLLEPMVVSTVVCNRDLALAQLFGFGLRRLGISRLELIETEADQYQRTIAWARALHGCNQRLDGLVWVSRQNDGTRSVMLFGDRVQSTDLESVGRSVPLKDGPGYRSVLQAAEQAGILVYQ